MLRVRPIVFTSRPDAWEPLLDALGMIQTVDGGDRLEFDAGSGRLALHRFSMRSAATGSPKDGTTVFGVEVGDLAEFARRTVADGTLAEVVEAPHGPAVRITAKDGFTFLADKATHGAVCADADPALAVVAVWLTPEVDGAARDLRNIGARARNVAVGQADSTTKNGGIIAARRTPEVQPPRGGPLEFEYDGGLDTLRGRLAAAGFEPRVEFGVLNVATPDGGTLVIRGGA